MPFGVFCCVMGQVAETRIAVTFNGQETQINLLGLLDLEDEGKTTAETSKLHTTGAVARPNGTVPHITVRCHT